MDKKLSYDSFFKFDRYFNMMDDDESAWADAFRHFVERGYKDGIAELLDNEKPIPVSAQKLLGQIFRNELKPLKRKRRSDNILSPQDEDEFLKRLEFLKTNCERVDALNLEVADILGKEPYEIKAMVSERWNTGLENLAKKFNFEPDSVRKKITSTEVKHYVKAVLGKEKLKVGNVLVDVVYGDNSDALEHGIEEALIIMKFPDVYLNPISPEALEPGSFDPYYLNNDESTPFYPDGRGQHLIQQERAERERLGGWWMRPDLVGDVKLE